MELEAKSPISFISDVDGSASVDITDPLSFIFCLSILFGMNLFLQIRNRSLEARSAAAGKEILVQQKFKSNILIVDGIRVESTLK